MKRWLAGACRLLGTAYVPEEVMDRPGEFLLHISDTPSSFFSDLRRIISKIRPAWVVHTGDLVDQIKLEVYPARIECYRNKLRTLSKILDGAVVRGDFQAMICMGNHDDLYSVKEMFPHCHIAEGTGFFSASGWHFVVSHYSWRIPDLPDMVGLCGHDLSYPSGDIRCLNGIEDIHLFSLKTGGVYRIPYPGYVDDQRQLKRRIGL